MSKPAAREPARLEYGNSQRSLAAVLRDVDFRVLLAFLGLRGTVWFWICSVRFRMEQLSRARLLVCHHCRFYGDSARSDRLRDLDRCSLVDFRKPRSIPLTTVGARSQRHSLGKAEAEAGRMKNPALTRWGARSPRDPRNGPCL
jgi:hypothetical protein